jgi:hypothetical protein
MRRILLVLIVAAGLALGGGVAAADPGSYEVSRSWLLTYRNGTPTVVPRIQDDVVEVVCRHGDQMTRYKVNNAGLVAAVFPRIDGTGVQVQPEFAEETARLRITVTCQR